MQDNVGIHPQSGPSGTWMDYAVEVARRAVGVSRPNPPVGALVVRDGKVVAEGCTSPVGGPHAEVVALHAAGELARGSEMYVTLEPCNHHGRTPPCTEAILRAGIRRVHVGALDPNPRVNGSGIARLREAGVEVVVDPADSLAQEYHLGYIRSIALHRPWIELKLAQTLDGCVAGPGGVRTSISCDEAWKWVHWRRSISDAVLVGGGTLRMDDPLLTVRHVSGNQPWRIVFSGGGDLPLSAKLFQPGYGGAVHVFSAASVSLPSAVQFHRLPVGEFLDLWKHMLTELAGAGLHRILVEMGPGLAASLLPSSWWDRLFVLTSPSLLGDGLRWTDRLPASWNASVGLSRFEPLGRDVLAVFDNHGAMPL